MASLVASIAFAAPEIHLRITAQSLPPAAAPIIVSLMPPKQRSWLRGMIAGALPIAGLITMLLALAFLQLRWSARVSDAERARLLQNLQHSTTSFQFAFAQDLLGICHTLQASQPRELPLQVNQLSDRFAVWRRISRHPGFIGDLYIWSTGSGASNILLKLDPQERTLQPVAWPQPLRQFAAPSLAGKRNLSLPRQPNSWLWDEQIPALIHPIYIPGKSGSPRPRLLGYLFVVFNPSRFEQIYLPDLGQRYFPLSNGFAFQLIQHNAGHEPRVVYQSDSHASAGVFAHPDATISLLEAATQFSPAAPSGASSANPGLTPVVLSAVSAQKWQIDVRHRSGSVDAAVTSLRRRDFAVSIIVLAMLLVSLITILAATRRARRLARLQMEFASGVSHELRTPLAVISSAAENLADGVVTGGDQVRDYGALIHRESQRLSGMVDHILEFAEMHSHPHSYTLENIVVAGAIDAVLATERPLFEAAGISVETNIPADLPLIHTDPLVLRQCLQNLLSNALKYGSDGRRIVLSASTARENSEDRVVISVTDFGAGIAPEELPHIYEPFYRATNARESQIPGTGLGLSLTRKMIEGLGGRITVESSPGKGSAFTLHIPITPATAVGSMPGELSSTR